MNKESKTQIKEYMDKMLKANEIGLELDLFVSPRYSETDGEFIGFKLFLAEHKAMRQICPLNPSNYNYLIMSLKQVLSKKHDITDMIDCTLYDKFGDLEDMTDEEYKEVEVFEKNLDRQVYEEKWFDGLCDKIDEKLESIK